MSELLKAMETQDFNALLRYCTKLNHEIIDYQMKVFLLEHELEALKKGKKYVHTDRHSSI